MTRSELWSMLGLAALIEVFTCALRFGFGLQATRDSALLAQFTGGLRIHHGYIGVLLIALSLLWPDGQSVRSWLMRIGGALTLSDFVHHFLVLWPLTGSPQFDLTYPRR